MNNLVYAEVPVGGTTILSVKDGDVILVPPRHLCAKLQIDWSNEWRRIKNDPILSKAVVNLTTALGNGQEQVFLPLNYLPGWLFKINLNTVAEDARPILEAIQRESHDALFAYWFKGAAINPRGGAAAGGAVQDILKLLDAVKREGNVAARQMIYAMLEQAGAARGVEVPSLEALSPTINDDAEADALLAMIDTLLMDRPELNHHRRAELIAIRTREMADAGVHISKTQRDALQRHPRFHGALNVNSGRIRKGVFCMVFRAA